MPNIIPYYKTMPNTEKVLAANHNRQKKEKKENLKAPGLDAGSFSDLGLSRLAIAYFKMSWATFPRPLK